MLPFFLIYSQSTQLFINVGSQTTLPRDSWSSFYSYQFRQLLIFSNSDVFSDYIGNYLGFPYLGNTSYSIVNLSTYENKYGYVQNIADYSRSLEYFQTNQTERN